MAGEKQELINNIDSLKAHVKVQYPESAGVKVLENIGDNAFVIKFAVFNDYDINLTIQIPSK